MKNNITSLTAIVLTFNEEMHLERCLKSLSKVCQEIVVVDSFSSDKTKEIALKYKSRFYENPFINHASQLNWAINNTNFKTDWVIRVDADEYIDEELQDEIIKKLPSLSENTIGLRLKRMMCFFNKPLKKGGMYPIFHLKIWRNGTAICEQRWMDERITLLKDGEIEILKGNLIDNNLNNITWWTQKHNSYATREAIDILDKLYNFTNHKLANSNFFGTPEERRRWFKMRYLKMRLFVRRFLFFLIRYFIQVGFLEGKRGFVWSILQCFWYRFLVDVKIFEALKKAGKDKEKLVMFFKDEYGFDVTKVG